MLSVRLLAGAGHSQQVLVISTKVLLFALLACASVWLQGRFAKSVTPW